MAGCRAFVQYFSYFSYLIKESFLTTDYSLTNRYKWIIKYLFHFKIEKKTMKNCEKITDKTPWL